MTNKYLILNVQQILSNNVDLKGELNELLDKNVFTEEEKIFIWTLTILLEDFNNYSPEEEPNAFLKQSLKDKVVEMLKELCSLEVPDLIKAKILDCLWINKREYESAKQAFYFYSQYIKMCNEFDQNFHIFMRVVALYIKPGQRKFEKKYLNECLSRLLVQGKENENALFLFILEASNKYSLLDIDELIKLANEKLIVFEDKHIIGNVTLKYFELLEQLYFKKFNIKVLNKISKNKYITEVRRRKADYYINCAKNCDYKKTNNYMNYINAMKKAINVLKLIDNTEEERKHILKEMADVQKQCAEKMPCFKQSINITDTIKLLENSLAKLNKEEALYFLVYYFAIIKKSEIQKRTLENEEKSVFGKLFSKEIVNKSGKTITVIPSIPKKDDKDYEKILEAKMFFNLSKEYSIYCSCGIKYVFNYINNKFNISEDDIKFIIHNSAFVPYNRKKAFVKGIMAGFKGDFITAINILIPQVENALRVIAEECGDLIYSINQEGIEQVKTLDSILDLPRINECFEEDLIFNLKAILVSKYCYNMRNDIAHGLYDDNEFNSEKMLFTWWFIFKLCYQMAVPPLNEM